MARQMDNTVSTTDRLTNLSGRPEQYEQTIEGQRTMSHCVMHRLPNN